MLVQEIADADGEGGRKGVADVDFMLQTAILVEHTQGSRVAGQWIGNDAEFASAAQDLFPAEVTEALSKLRLFPLIHFPVSDVKVSLWVLMAVGLATGYLAGTIGVGGFIGVPAMIYVFGVPTAVAAGTELYLAMFMGAYGALSYAYQGLLDIRLTMLLYLGSLIGIHLGVYGVKVVNERYIRITTSLIILLCVVSRGIAMPVYLRQLQLIAFDPAWDVYLNMASKAFLFISGSGGAIVILYHVIRAFKRRRKIQKTLLVVREPATG